MDQKYESLETYHLLAKKIVSKFASPFIKVDILNNEEALSEIAEAIMIADWKWDSSRQGHNGQSKTRYSYRNQCGLWAIKTYTTKKIKKQNKESYINNSSTNDTDYMNNISCSNSYNPYEIVSQQEEKELISNSINEILNSNILSDKQKDQIKEYYFEDKTLLEIGKKYGVSREAIRQNIQKGLSKIREYTS
jgi:RNA polymerase sigma factor (sigma-70 family)